MAFDSSPAKGGAKPPISLHPAFPAVVALWFAALLGLGSLVLPAILLDRAVEATGLASLIPAASPPLGFTARGAIALAAALLGAGIGLALAWRVAQSHTPSAAPRFATADQRRPISVRDELDDDGIAAAAPPKRRALAMSEDQRPSDFLWAAPLPGEDLASGPAEPTHLEADDALELSEVACEAQPLEPVAPAEQAPDPDAQASLTEAPPAMFPPADELERRRQERRGHSATLVLPSFERRTYLRRVDDEPLPFLAPSLTRRPPDNENTAGEAMSVTVSFDRPAAAVEIMPVPDAGPAPQPADWDTAPLTDLGTAELVQRLAASLERHRQLAAAAPPGAAPPPVTPEAPEAFEAAPPEEAAQAMAAYFGRPTAIAESAPDELPPAPPPATVAYALEPFAPPADTAEADHPPDDLAASFSLPLRAVAAPGEEDAAGPATEADNGDYGSLLSLRNPFEDKREEFVRIEAPEADTVAPSVVFPGHADGGLTSVPARSFDPPSTATAEAAPAFIQTPPAGTDEALRRALATLQRMSRSG